MGVSTGSYEGHWKVREGSVLGHVGVPGRSGRGQYWVIYWSLGGQRGVSTGSCRGPWEVREGSVLGHVGVTGRSERGQYWVI